MVGVASVARQSDAPRVTEALEPYILVPQSPAGGRSELPVTGNEAPTEALLCSATPTCKQGMAAAPAPRGPLGMASRAHCLTAPKCSVGACRLTT